jgi:hypothetical protein
MNAKKDIKHKINRYCFDFEKSNNYDWE